MLSRAAIVVPAYRTTDSVSGLRTRTGMVEEVGSTRAHATTIGRHFMFGSLKLVHTLHGTTIHHAGCCPRCTTGRSPG